MYTIFELIPFSMVTHCRLSITAPTFAAYSFLFCIFCTPANWAKNHVSTYNGLEFLLWKSRRANRPVCNCLLSSSPNKPCSRNWQAKKQRQNDCHDHSYMMLLPPRPAHQYKPHLLAFLLTYIFFLLFLTLIRNRY